MKDSGGYQVEDMLLSVYDQSVAGVVSTLKPDDEIRLFSKQIDNFALPFIAPLSAHYDYIRHIFIFLSSHISARSPGPSARIPFERFHQKNRGMIGRLGFTKPDSSSYL
jgi:hypothetical protein